MQKLDIYKYQSKRLNNLIYLFFEKASCGNERMLIFCDNKKKLDFIDKLLWEYNPPSWVPHLMDSDKYAEHAKIILSTDTNKNLSDVVCIIDSKITSFDIFKNFKHVAYFVPLNETEYSESIEILKSNIQNSNTYNQNSNGKWIKEE